MTDNSLVSRRRFLCAAGAVTALSAVPRSLRAASRVVDPSSSVSTIHISSSTTPIVFDPDKALGSSMDILPHEAIDKVYTPETVKQCLSAGWGPITYRQKIEFSIGAWHWNPNGAWSDAANKRGYFTGSADVTEAIRYSYGYPLPHRGHTRNGGAERGYSRARSHVYQKNSGWFAG